MDNFFRDYSNNQNESEVLRKSFAGLFDILQSQVNEISRNNNISKILTYRRVQFQKIDISGAIYSLSDLLNDTSIMSVIGVEKNTSLNEKMDLWESMTPIEKANLLDIANYSIMLTSFAHLLNEDEFLAKKFNVIDFELTDLSNNKYIKNIDYVFFDNKLFLLKQFSADDIYREKYLILKDIVIDVNTTEDILGEHLNIPYNYEFTKTDYTETLKGFIQAAAAGPTLDNLTKSLTRYKALDEVKVYDKYSATEIISPFWGTDEKIGTLTKFDFIIAMPVNFIYKPEKLEYIRKFFSQIRPAYANFIFTPELQAKDELQLKFKDDVMTTKGTMKPFIDLLPHSDTPYSLTSFSLINILKNQKSITLKTPTHSILSSFKDFKDSLERAPIYRPIDNISEEEKFNYKLDMVFGERKVYFPWQKKHDGFSFDKDRFFDPLQMKSLLNPMPQIPILSKLKNYNDLIGIDYVKGNFKENIKESNFISSALQLDFYDVAKNNNYKEGNFIADSNDCLDNLIFSSLESKKIITQTADSLSCDDNLSALNGKILYDKLNSENGIENFSNLNKTDNIKKVSRANIIKCDSIFNSDYNEITNLYLDSEPEGYEDSGVSEMVELVLIPKN